MLDIMRRKKRLKLVLWLVIISLGLGMLLFFVPGQNTGISGIDSYAASVAGEDISLREFSEAYRRLVDSYSANGRNKIDYDMLKRLGADRQALQALIQKRVIAYAAGRLGLDVTTEEVRQAIESNPNLRDKDGFVGVETYKAVLEANRIDVTQFETDLRYTLLGRKLMHVLTDSLTVPESTLRENFARQTQEAQVQYVLFEKGAAEKRIKPAEAELKTYFDANKTRYSIKEQRRAQYLLLATDPVAATIQVSDREIDDAWNRSDHEEKVEASHILFKVEDPAKEAEVKAKAEDVLKRARAGANFAELAKRYSQDESSAAQGGHLDPFGRGDMDKSFEAAAFALRPGEISDLVRSVYGYHIIKVISHETPTKETRRASLIRDVQAERAREIVREKAAAAEKLGETQKDLSVIAKSLDIPAAIRETPPLSQTSDTVANGISQEFLDELFRLKEVNSIGKGVEVPDGWAIPKLLQVTLPREAEFKEVQEAVRKDYVESKAADLMQADARKLSEEATKLKDLAQAAQKQGLALKTSASFKRDGAPAPEIGTSTEFSAAAFNTPVGGISEPVNVAAGKYVAVLQVKTRSPINETEYAKQKPVLREQALSSVREAYFLEYINRVTDELQKARKIKVSQQALDRITGGR